MSESLIPETNRPFHLWLLLQSLGILCQTRQLGKGPREEDATFCSLCLNLESASKLSALIGGPGTCVHTETVPFHTNSIVMPFNSSEEHRCHVQKNNVKHTVKKQALCLGSPLSPRSYAVHSWVLLESAAISDHLLRAAIQ